MTHKDMHHYMCACMCLHPQAHHVCVCVYFVVLKDFSIGIVNLFSLEDKSITTQRKTTTTFPLPNEISLSHSPCKLQSLAFVSSSNFCFYRLVAEFIFCFVYFDPSYKRGRTRAFNSILNLNILYLRSGREQSCSTISQLVNSTCNA